MSAHPFDLASQCSSAAPFPRDYNCFRPVQVEERVRLNSWDVPADPRHRMSTDCDSFRPFTAEDRPRKGSAFQPLDSLDTHAEKLLDFHEFQGDFEGFHRPRPFARPVGDPLKAETGSRVAEALPKIPEKPKKTSKPKSDSKKDEKVELRNGRVVHSEQERLKMKVEKVKFYWRELSEVTPNVLRYTKVYEEGEGFLEEFQDFSGKHLLAQPFVGSKEGEERE